MEFVINIGESCTASLHMVECINIVKQYVDMLVVYGTDPCRLSLSEMSPGCASIARITLVVGLPPRLPIYLQVCHRLMPTF